MANGAPLFAAFSGPVLLTIAKYYPNLSKYDISGNIGSLYYQHYSDSLRRVLATPTQPFYEGALVSHGVRNIPGPGAKVIDYFSWALCGGNGGFMSANTTEEIQDLFATLTPADANQLLMWVANAFLTDVFYQTDGELQKVPFGTKYIISPMDAQFVNMSVLASYGIHSPADPDWPRIIIPVNTSIGARLFLGDGSPDPFPYPDGFFYIPSGGMPAPPERNLFFYIAPTARSIVSKWICYLMVRATITTDNVVAEVSRQSVDAAGGLYLGLARVAKAGKEWVDSFFTTSQTLWECISSGPLTCITTFLWTVLKVQVQEHPFLALFTLFLFDIAFLGGRLTVLFIKLTGNTIPSIARIISALLDFVF